ncbi:MAG: MsnO8 family LLM class oxidoreductase, partial [Kurthia sp.]
TAQALGRDPYRAPNDFPEDIQELLLYLGDDNDTQVHAYPGEHTNVPVYLLGSSLYSAELAAKLGLPYAFASHFASAHLENALHLYRQNFQPSQYLSEPYTIACINGIAANSDAEAKRMLTSLHQYFLSVITGDQKKLQPPIDSMKDVWTMQQREAVLDMLRFTLVGDPETVEKQLNAFMKMTDVDEIMITSHIYDQEQRYRSYEIIKQIVEKHKK